MQNLKQQIESRSEYSPFIWAISNVVLDGSKRWDFSERKWQIPIFEDTYPRIVSKKSAQVGETTIFISKALWFMDYRPISVIWTFPRQDDVSEFVQTRFYPILNSPSLAAHVGRSSEDPKSLRITKYRDSYIYFQEASVDPRMTPADLLANDEVDRSNPDNLDAYAGRLENSSYKIHWRFSTPTIPGYGIDKIFKDESDQRYWMVKCPHCNHQQSLKWDVNFMQDHDKTPYYGCEKCRGELSPECIIEGEFVAMKPGRNVHGYHVTGMMMPVSKTPSYMYDKSLSMNQKNFYNILLGECYEPMGMRFDSDSILNNVFDPNEEPYPHASTAKGGTYMGVDQKGPGDLHVVIAQPVTNNATNKEILRIIHVQVIKQDRSRDSWDELADLMQRYNIRFCVHDAMPNQHNARAFRESFVGRVGLKYDGPERAELYRFDESNGQVLLTRNANFDGLLDDIRNGLWRFYGSRRPMYPELSELVAHCGNLKRDEEERKGKDGGIQSIGVWRHVGPDDFAHAWAYCRVAYLIRPSNRMQVTLIGGAKDQEEQENIIGYRKSTVWDNVQIPIMSSDKRRKVRIA